MDYLNLLVDTKKEFSIYLINNLSPEISKGIYSIYLNCKNRVEENNNLLISFQQVLSEVPNWNSSVLYSETNRIKNKISYIEDLLTAVFISNMRLLCSIKNKNKQIKVRVPKMETFIHKCYVEVAKQFWSYTYLFNQNINKLEIQKNNRQIDIIIKNSIEEVIRKLLPIKSILKDYLETNFDTETNIETDINTPLIDIINKKTKNKDKDYTNEEINAENNEEDYHKNVDDNKEGCSEDKSMIGGNIEINENLFLDTIGNNELIVDAPNILYNEGSIDNNISNDNIKLPSENLLNDNIDDIKIVNIEGGQNEKIEEQEKKEESTNKIYENKFETHKTN